MSEPPRGQAPRHSPCLSVDRVRDAELSVLALVAFDPIVSPKPSADALAGSLGDLVSRRSEFALVDDFGLYLVDHFEDVL